MATGSVTFSLTNFSPTYKDLSAGSTATATQRKTYGSAPSGANITGGSVTIGPIRTYSSNVYIAINGYGESGTFSVHSSASGHDNVEFSKYSNDILSVVSETVEISVFGSKINFREGCAATLTVFYEAEDPLPEQSTVTLNGNEVSVGNDISLSVYNSYGSQCAHTVRWHLNDECEVIQTGIGNQTFELTIPETWLNHIVSSDSITGYVTVTTSYDAVQVGRETLTYTVHVPDDVVPSIGTVAATRYDYSGYPSSWNVYVQNISGVTISATGASGSYGSTIISYTFYGGMDTVVTTSSSYSQSLIPHSGNVTYYVKVTDSRGRTKVGSVNIYVYEYSIPSFSNSIAYRCSSAGVSSENGTYVNLSTEATYSPCGGNNSLTMNAYYRLSTDTSWTNAVSQLEAGQTYIIGGGFSAGSSYQIKLEGWDQFNSIQKIIDVSTGLYTIFFKKGGRAIGLGTQAKKDNLIEVNESWDIDRNGVKVFERLESVPTIVFSETEPTGTEGAIWLKPV